MGFRFILDAVQACNIRSSRYRIFLFNDNSGETDMYNADRILDAKTASKINRNPIFLTAKRRRMKKSYDLL